MKKIEEKSEKASFELSTVNKSSTRIHNSEYQKLVAQMKQVKYPTYPIDHAVDIQKKLSSLKNATVQKQLEKYVTNYRLNSYRRVRGDGNCFFRAVAFEFLANAPDTSVDKCFPFLDKICLTCCFSESIPKEFQKFYDYRFLSKVLSYEWQTKIRQISHDKKASRKTLLKVFDINPFLDFIIILYFRAVCLKSLQNISGSELKEYLCGNQQATIRTYSQQSEGIVLHLCSRILKIKILVYEIRKNQVIKYKHTCEGNPISVIYLLFENSHYDILENYSQIDSQKSVVLKSSQYYGEVDQNIIQGICIECGITGHIYEENCLCNKCYKQNLKNMVKLSQKQPYSEGVCLQCHKKKKNISVNYRICKECLEIQKKTLKNNQQGNHSYQPQKQDLISRSKLFYDLCTCCRYTGYLNLKTGLCFDCERQHNHRKKHFFGDDINSQGTQKRQKAGMR